MILAPIACVAGSMNESPVTIRLVGLLDRVVIESFSDTFAGLAVPGGRTLIVLVRDLVFVQGQTLDRFLAILCAYEDAGHRVLINGTSTWRKITGARGARFAQSSAIENQSSRRLVMICHSAESAVGAA